LQLLELVDQGAGLFGGEHQCGPVGAVFVERHRWQVTWGRDDLAGLSVDDLGVDVVVSRHLMLLPCRWGSTLRGRCRGRRSGLPRGTPRPRSACKLDALDLHWANVSPARPGPASAKGVSDVVASGAHVQVSGVAARTYVAVMEHHHPDGDGALRKHVGHPVG